MSHSTPSSDEELFLHSFFDDASRTAGEGSNRPKLTEPWLYVSKPIGGLNQVLQERKCIEQMRWSLASNNDISKARDGLSRFAGKSSHRFIIPRTLACDRVYLRHLRDCVYIEAAVRYLRGLSVNIPILVDEIWSFPEVAKLEDQPMARNWALGAAEASWFHNRVIPPTDWVAFNVGSIQGLFTVPKTNSESMMVPASMFPSIPHAIRKCMPKPHLGIEEPRIGYYFGWLVENSFNIELKRTYDELYVKEYCINYVVGFMQDVKRGRIWDIRDDFNSLLKDEIFCLPGIPHGFDDVERTFLGDFSKFRILTNPWLACKYFVDIPRTMFEMGKGVYTSKELVFHKRGYFVETKDAEGKELCELEYVDDGEETDSKTAKAEKLSSHFAHTPFVRSFIESTQNSSCIAMGVGAKRISTLEEETSIPSSSAKRQRVPSTEPTS